MSAIAFVGVLKERLRAALELLGQTQAAYDTMQASYLDLLQETLELRREVERLRQEQARRAA